jgi:hypothetical protein
MRVKNYGDLSEHVFNEIENNLDNINEVLVGDTYSAASTVIEIDLKSLLHQAVMGKLGEMGVVNNREYSKEGYSNGLAIDLDEIKIEIENGRMIVYTTRGEIGEIE